MRYINSLLTFLTLTFDSRNINSGSHFDSYNKHEQLNKMNLHVVIFVYYGIKYFWIWIGFGRTT